jgi:rhodanese-related sulfurtransferase
VAKTLQSLGYKDVTVYAGGLPQWQEEGLATTASAGKNTAEKPAKEQVAAANGIPSGADEGTIDGEWIKDLITKKALPENIQLVAVVPPEDFQGGYLEGAVNVHAEPLQPEELYEKLPKDKVVVFCCTSGSRALEAWYKLSDAKLDTSNIYYFDANINCEEGSECKIDVHEPLG